MSLTATHLAVAASELVALVLVWRLLKSDEHPVFKIAFSLLAVVPLLGPVLVLWLAHFPGVNPPALQNRHRYSAAVFDRWRSVLEEKNPVVKFRKWKKLISSSDDRGS